MIQATYEKALEARDALEREARRPPSRACAHQEDRNAISAVLVDARRRADELEASARDGRTAHGLPKRRPKPNGSSARPGAAEAIVQGRRTAEERIRAAEERAELLAEETRRHAEAEIAQALEVVERHRAEAEHIAGLQQEMRAGYRAFLLAAFELVERHLAPANGRARRRARRRSAPSRHSGQDEQRAEPPPETVQEAPPVTAKSPDPEPVGMRERRRAPACGRVEDGPSRGESHAATLSAMVTSAERRFASSVTPQRMTPAALGQITFARSVRGYNPAQVDDVLREIRTSYEELWRRARGVRRPLSRPGGKADAHRA